MCFGVNGFHIIFSPCIHRYENMFDLFSGFNWLVSGQFCHRWIRRPRSSEGAERLEVPHGLLIAISVSVPRKRVNVNVILQFSLHSSRSSCWWHSPCALSVFWWLVSSLLRVNLYSRDFQLVAKPFAHFLLIILLTCWELLYFYVFQSPNKLELQFLFIYLLTYLPTHPLKNENSNIAVVTLAHWNVL